MNIIELQDSLKDVSDDVLMKEMQMPSGNAPQFLVLSELKRRKRMRDEFQRREAADIPTVAEETITAAGMPQQGIMQAARAMAPKSSIAQNTGMDMAMPMQPTQAPQQPQMMADGGVVKMQRGGAISAQPTGDGGTYILMQDGERVPGTGLYPDFRSANEAARALRGSQPFQTARILEEPDPILETEVSELSQVSADPMAFAANDEIRRQLQLRQARGQRDDAEVGGITSLDPFGRAFMDEYRPDMSVASSQEGIPEFGDAAYAQTNVADLLETMSKANEGIVRDELPASADDDLRFSRGTASSIAPSAGSEAINAMRAGADLAQLSGGIGRVSADLSNVEGAPQGIDFDAAGAGSPIEAGTGIRGSDTKASKELAEFLASRRSDVPGANLPGDSYVYEIDPNAALRAGESLSDDVAMADLMAQAQIEREGFGAVDPSIAPDVDLSGIVAVGSGGDQQTSEDLGLLQRATNALENLDAQLASPDLTESERKALGVQRSALNAAISTGQFLDDTVADSVALINRFVAGPVLDFAAGTTSLFSPEAGASMFEFADQFDAGTDKIAEEGFFPETRDRTAQELIDAGFTGGDIDPSDVPTPVESSRQLIEAGFTGSEDAPFLTPTVTTDGGGVTTGDTDTGTARGGADFGSIESRIARMLADREKSAEADKWMSLAQAGMALMASKNPTFGGALGEAGLAGISSMQKARSQYDKDILGLLGMQQQIESAKDLAAYRQGSLDAKGDSTKSIGQQIDDARAYLNTLTSEARSYRRVAEGDLATGTEDRIIDMTPPDLKAEIIAAQDRLKRLERLRSGVTEPVYDATK